MKVDVKYDHKRDCIEVAVRTENGHCHIEYVSMIDLLDEPLPAEPPPKKRERIHIAPGCDTVAKLNKAMFYYTGKSVDIFLSPKDWKMIWEELKADDKLVNGYDGKCFFMFLGKLVYKRDFGELPAKPQESPWDKKLREELARGDDIWGSIAKKYK